MKKIVAFVVSLSALLAVAVPATAQDRKSSPAGSRQETGVDSIAFHLYTDSLKKGVHNYINVDGRMAGGRWLPLTSREIRFSSDAGAFEGNNLILPPDFKGEKVTITATYMRNPQLSKTISIYIKKNEEAERLKSREEVMRELQAPRPKRKRGGN